MMVRILSLKIAREMICIHFVQRDKWHQHLNLWMKSFSGPLSPYFNFYSWRHFHLNICHQTLYRLFPVQELVGLFRSIISFSFGGQVISTAKPILH